MTFIGQYMTKDDKQKMSNKLDTFVTLTTKLKLTKEQLTNIKSIINIWPSYKNVYFTNEKFNILPYPVNDYKPWQDFFTACKI
jgi:hypothetical protein